MLSARVCSALLVANRNYGGTSLQASVAWRKSGWVPVKIHRLALWLGASEVSQVKFRQFKLEVSTLQMCVLLVVNEQKVTSMEELCEQLGTNDRTLKRHVQALTRCCCLLRCAATFNQAPATMPPPGRSGAAGLSHRLALLSVDLTERSLQ
jgi:hypothetical protein